MSYAIRKDDENLTLHSVKHSSGFLLSWDVGSLRTQQGTFPTILGGRLAGLSLQGLQVKVNQIVPVTFCCFTGPW